MRSRGFALATVVMLLALVAAAVFALTREATLGHSRVDQSSDSAMAHYTAQAGLEHAKWVADNSSCASYDLPVTTFGAHSYVASFAPGANSPVAITVKGTTADGASATEVRQSVRVFETTQNVVTLQPDATDGKDTYFYEWHPTWNYGASTTVVAGDFGAGSKWHALLEFDLSGIPSSVRVVSATLDLYQPNTSYAGGKLGVRRVMMPWDEGSASGGVGIANWNERSAGKLWTNPGGDLAATPFGSATVPRAVGWNQWDVTSLVAGWTSGDYANYGLALVHEASMAQGSFASSDHSDPTLHPKLTITYACECGVGGGSFSELLQPGASVGKDARIIAGGSQGSKNYGGDASIWISNDGATHEGLIEFDLAQIPVDANVTAATLELYNSSTDANSNGVISVHRATQPWVEGTGGSSGGDPPDGATWFTHDGVDSWAAPGGDYDSTIIDSVLVPDLVPRWYQWNVATPVRNWLDGTWPNEGLLLRGTSGAMTKVYLSTSDHNTVANHPKLAVYYTCPCGGCTPVAAPPPACTADYAATGIVSEFSTAAYSQMLNRGVTYFPPGQSLGGVISPAEGAWIAVGGSGILWMVGMDGSELDGSYATGLSQLEGIAFVPAANPSDPGHLAIVKGSTLYYSDLSLPAGSSFTLHHLPFLTSAGGITYINGGTYDGHLAIADKSNAQIHIVDAGFNLVFTMLGGSLLTAPEGIAHLTDTDKFLVIDTGSHEAIIIDTAMVMSQKYDLMPLALGGASGAAAAIHPTSCDHFFGDRPHRRYAYLNVGGAGLGPIAHWKLDDASGNTAIDSVGAHHGAVVSDPVWVAGTLAGALDLDGANDYVDAGTFDVVGSGLTMMGWFNAEILPNLAPSIISKANGTGVANSWWQLSIGGAGANRHLRMQVKAGATTTELGDSTVPLATGQWYFAVGTYDNATGGMRLYVDGVKVASRLHDVGGAIDTDPTVSVHLGSNGTAERFFEGVLDDVRVYNYALSAGKIADLYAAGSGGGGGGGGGVVFEEFTEGRRAIDTDTGVSVPKPSGTAVGDLLLVAVATDGDTVSTLSPPPSWGLSQFDIGTGHDGSGAVTFGLWWKIADGTEPGGITYQWTGGEQAYAWIMRFTGHDPASPFATAAVTTGNSKDPLSTNLITSSDGNLILRLAGFDDDDIMIDNPGLSGHTAITMDRSNTGNLNTVSGGAGYLTQTSAGDTGISTFALTAKEQFRAITIAIRPAP